MFPVPKIQNKNLITVIIIINLNLNYKLSKNPRDTRHSGFLLKPSKCGNSINNHLGFDKWFCHLFSFSIWKIITWAIVLRSNCNNKLNQKPTEMNVLCIFQILYVSDCVLFILCDFYSFTRELWLWLKKNIYFNV